MLKVKKDSMKIEDVIRNTLSGQALNDTLAFITYLRENKMNPVNTSKNGWKISSKACVVCYIWLNLDTGTLQINPFINEYEPNSLSDDLKEIVWSKKTHGSTCGECQVIAGKYNCSYKVKTVFGKRFEDACARSISFINPNSVEIECIKKLLELRKSTIKNGKRLPTSPTNFG